MAEITPVMPSSVVAPVIADVQKVMRDDSRKSSGQKQSQPEKRKAGKTETDGQAILHIDEIV